MPNNRSEGKPRRFQAFATEAQARAFVEGVEFVNDSALEVIDVEHRPQNATPWVVVMEDEDFDGNEFEPEGLSLDGARAAAQAIADEQKIAMVVGYQYDDFTADGRAFGYCPRSVAGPAFVFEVLETIEPRAAAQQVRP